MACRGTVARRPPCTWCARWMPPSSSRAPTWSSTPPLTSSPDCSGTGWSWAPPRSRSPRNPRTALGSTHRSCDRAPSASATASRRRADRIGSSPSDEPSRAGDAPMPPSRAAYPYQPAGGPAVPLSSADLTVSVAGAPRTVTTGTTAADLFAQDKAVVVARIGGELRDLAHVLADGDVVEPVGLDTEEGLAVLRHSAAHVLAQAVQQVDPKARLGIGPPIGDGFYYDFDVETPFTPEDLKVLEKAMQKIINEGQTFQRRVVTDEVALKELADEPYKCELIGLKSGSSKDALPEAVKAVDGASAEVGAGELTIYDNLRRDGSRAWGDLCRGPHVPTTKVLGNAFKLMRTAAAYWRGSEKNPQLQRVYGTAWPTKDDLRAYLERLAEAEKRDHRKLGAELDLFSFPDEIGSGLSVWH